MVHEHTPCPANAGEPGPELPQGTLCSMSLWIKVQSKGAQLLQMAKELGFFCLATSQKPKPILSFCFSSLPMSSARGCQGPLSLEGALRTFCFKTKQKTVGSHLGAEDTAPQGRLWVHFVLGSAQEWFSFARWWHRATSRTKEAE